MYSFILQTGPDRPVRFDLCEKIFITFRSGPISVFFSVWSRSLYFTFSKDRTRPILLFFIVFFLLVSHPMCILSFLTLFPFLSPHPRALSFFLRVLSFSLPSSIFPLTCSSSLIFFSSPHLLRLLLLHFFSCSLSSALQTHSLQLFFFRFYLKWGLDFWFSHPKNED